MAGNASDVRIGLIGAGAIAQIAHLPVLRKLKGVQIAAICDSDGPKARALAQRLGGDASYTDIEEMLEFAKPDAVVMHCLPAHRGEEVEASVIDASCSVVFRQAENRVHTEKALLLALMGQVDDTDAWA